MLKISLRPLAGAEGVAVHADDAGKRPAVGIQGGRGVVGLDLEDERPVVVESDHPGIVLENRETEVLFPELFPHFFGGALDEALEQGFYLRPVPLFVLIMDRAREISCVCSVPTRSGLGISSSTSVGIAAESHLAAFRHHMRITISGPE